MRSVGEAARAADWLAAQREDGQVERVGANGIWRRASEERPNRRACAWMRFTDEEMHAHGPRAFRAFLGPFQLQPVANQTV